MQLSDADSVETAVEVLPAARIYETQPIKPTHVGFDFLARAPLASIDTLALRQPHSEALPAVLLA